VLLYHRPETKQSTGEGIVNINTKHKTITTAKSTECTNSQLVVFDTIERHGKAGKIGDGEDGDWENSWLAR